MQSTASIRWGAARAHSSAASSATGPKFRRRSRGCGHLRDRQAGMRIALFEPEIAGNVGAVLRLGACLGMAVDLIEPMGFQWDDKRVRRTAMDYIDHVKIARHRSFEEFRASSGPARLVLFTTKAAHSL